MGKCGCVGSLLPVSTQLSWRPVHGNTRAALDTTTPQINEASHILLWFDNQSQNITGEMCPKYHGKCVHWVGLNYCKKCFAQKNWVTTGFLIFTIFWCIFRFFWYFGRDVGCLTIALMENSNLARSKKLYLWNQKVPRVLRMRSISRPFTNIIFATQRRKAVKSLTEVQTFLISLPKNLFTGSRLEICLSGQPENFPVMHHVKSVGFGIPAVTVGCPRIGPFIVRIKNKDPCF